MTAITITEQQLYLALWTFLKDLALPGLASDGTSVVQGQDNRVSQLTGNYIVMQSLYMPILSTNKTRWTPGSANPGIEGNARSQEWVCQLDVYGENASDIAAIISLVTKTPYAADRFATYGVDMEPLYATEPRQTTMINGEQQYESRYTLEFHAQYNPVVTTPLDFATQLRIGLAEVDTKFPPES